MPAVQLLEIKESVHVTLDIIREIRIRYVQKNIFLINIQKKVEKKTILRPRAFSLFEEY